MLMETNTITYLARFIYRIRYKLFLGSIITCLLTIYFTRFLPKTYTVSTSIYTGIVSGGSINAETSMNWNETNNAFENIIQLIRSKKTLEQVSLHLLAQDLTYGDLTQDTRYISSENYKNLLKYTKDLTPLVDRNSVEKTFQNLNHHLQDSPDNLIYRILSSERPFYSFHALNKISARRLGTSDMLEIVYESCDPGITYNTIKLLTEELLKGYENIRFGASHDVIKYFEEQIKLIQKKLRSQEDSLMNFSTRHRIINYTDQTKHLAELNKDYENRYQETLLAYTGSLNLLQKLEKQLDIKTLLTQENEGFIKTLDEISSLNSKITELETFTTTSGDVNTELLEYKRQLKAAEEKIAKISINMDVYKYTKEGLKVEEMVQEWLRAFVQNKKAEAEVKTMQQLRDKIDEEIFRFSPLGPSLKRQEREIGISEETYKELLHGLSLARLKQKNIEVTSTTLDVTVPPTYPIFPNATKRLLYIIAAFIGSIVFIMGFYFLIELLDRTLRDAERAEHFSKGKVLGVFPNKGSLKYRGFNRVCQRQVIQYTCNSLQDLLVKNKINIFNFVSIDPKQGKSYIINEIKEHWEDLGFKVTSISYEQDFNTTSPDYIYATSILNITSIPKDIDILLVEYPDLKNHQFPAPLLTEAIVNLVIIDANQAWKDCDQHAFNQLITKAKNSKTFLYLNKAEREAVEEYTGQLPPYTLGRRLIYKLFHFELSGRTSLDVNE